METTYLRVLAEWFVSDPERWGVPIIEPDSNTLIVHPRSWANQATNAGLGTYQGLRIPDSSGDLF